MRTPAQHTAPPVFVDRTGRRRRVVKLAGSALGTLFLAGLVLLIVALSGGSTLRLPGFSDAGRPASGADSAPDVPGEPAPSESPTDAAQPISSDSGAATPTPTSPRRVPTQTPTHQPKPTKT